MGGARTAGAMGGEKAICDAAALNQDISDAPWYGIQINGKGYIGADSNAMEPGGSGAQQPLVINVRKGKRYRMRVIGGMSSWALKVNVTGHGMQVIALDGRPVTPRNAQAVVVSSGERFDFVLNADQPVGNYWVDVSTVDGNNSPAILHYDGAPDPLKDAKFLQSRRTKLACVRGGTNPGLLDLKNATFVAALGVPAPPKTANKAFTIFLPDAAATVPPASFQSRMKTANNVFGLKPTAPISTEAPACPGGGLYCWSVNWNVYKAPTVAPAVLTSKSVPGPRTYNLEVKLGDVFDLVLVNPSIMVHPMHFHGQGFWVLGSGNGQILTPSDTLDPSKLKLNLANPPLRDTVAVPQAVNQVEGEANPAGFGYTVVRVAALNPGVWAFHCHIDLHANSGMFMTVTIAGGDWGLPNNLQCKGVGSVAAPPMEATTKAMPKQPGMAPAPAPMPPAMQMAKQAPMTSMRP